jgi:hypothetical protein
VDSPSTLALSWQLSVSAAVRYENELQPEKSTHSIEQNALAATVVVFIGLIVGKYPT